MERRPGTPSLLRELNDRAALELLLTGGPMTRAQLGEHTGLSKVTASQLLARLEDRGLVRVAGEQAGGRGPNAALYGVVPSSAYVAGLHVERGEVSAGVADVTGHVVTEVSARVRGRLLTYPSITAPVPTPVRQSGLGPLATRKSRGARSRRRLAEATPAAGASSLAGTASGGRRTRGDRRQPRGTSHMGQR